MKGQDQLWGGVSGRDDFHLSCSPLRGYAPIDDLRFGDKAIRERREIIFIRMDSNGSPVHLDDDTFQIVANRHPVSNVEWLLQTHRQATENICQCVLEREAGNDCGRSRGHQKSSHIQVEDGVENDQDSRDVDDHRPDVGEEPCLTRLRIPPANQNYDVYDELGCYEPPDYEESAKPSV